MTVKLLNRSNRSFIVGTDEIISGGKVFGDGTNPHKKLFAPEDIAVFTGEKGEWLLKNYPNSVKRIEEPVQEPVVVPTPGRPPKVSEPVSSGKETSAKSAKNKYGRNSR